MYTFHRDSYLIDVAWEIENTGDAPVQTEAYFQLQRDDVAPDGDSFMLSTFYGVAVYTEAEKYQKAQYKEIAENKARFAKTANNGWLAMVSIISSAPGRRRAMSCAISTCADWVTPTAIFSRRA